MRFEKQARVPATQPAVRLKPFGTQQSRQQVDKQQQSHDARQHNHGSLSKTIAVSCGVSGTVITRATLRRACSSRTDDPVRSARLTADSTRCRLKRVHTRQQRQRPAPWPQGPTETDREARPADSSRKTPRPASALGKRSLLGGAPRSHFGTQGLCRSLGREPNSCSRPQMTSLRALGAPLVRVQFARACLQIASGVSNFLTVGLATELHSSPKPSHNANCDTLLAPTHSDHAHSPAALAGGHRQRGDRAALAPGQQRRRHSSGKLSQCHRHGGAQRGRRADRFVVSIRAERTTGPGAATVHPQLGIVFRESRNRKAQHHRPRRRGVGRAARTSRRTTTTERAKSFTHSPRPNGKRTEAYYRPSGLLEVFGQIKDVSGQILHLNQTNMEQASADARRLAKLSSIGFAVALAKEIDRDPIAIFWG